MNVPVVGLGMSFNLTSRSVWYCNETVWLHEVCLTGTGSEGGGAVRYCVMYIGVSFV